MKAINLLAISFLIIPALAIGKSKAKFTNCTDYLSEPLYIKVGKCDAYCSGKMECDYSHPEQGDFIAEMTVLCKAKKKVSVPIL